MPGGFDPVLTDILEGVEKRGEHEIDWLILLNTSFRREAGRPSPESQLRAWEQEHGLTHTTSNEQHGKKIVQLLRFRRASKA
jgi:hypothetical protein